MNSNFNYENDKQVICVGTSMKYIKQTSNNLNNRRSWKSEKFGV
jgi:hypothetical protein